jgi:hypothetical protein
MKTKTAVKAGTDTVEVQAWSLGVKSPYDVATGHTSGKG